MFVRTLDGAQIETDDRIPVERLDPADAVRQREVARLVAIGKESVRAGGSPSAEAFAVADLTTSCRRVATFVAIIDGQPAAAGSAGVWRGHPLSAAHLNLYGAATLPVFRGRGAQTALMRARLAWGTAEGAVTASLDCRPGVASERNARRLGFELIYSKPVFHKALDGGR
ncbi:MAG: hypothetical protein CMJ31_09460 [Phycisphaerae bacterium]|nr:hypothetical protein [Phycisphaerae bacterium]